MAVIKIKKSQFSTMYTLKVDNKKVISDETFKGRLESLRQEREYLENDLHLIKNAIRAVSKSTTGETATNEEKESFKELVDNYPAFFDSDEENEQNEVSQLTKVTMVKRYIKNEIVVNKNTMSGLLKQSENNPLSNSDILPRKKQDYLEKQSSPLPESSKTASSKESVDVDDVVYNPFDDLGTD